MKKGIISVIIYYVIGFLITLLSYFGFNHSNAHGPSLYHIIIFLTVLGGFFWAIIAFAFSGRSDKQKGIVFTNIIVLIGLFVIFWFII